jgi:hypothetical protein
MAHLLFAAHDSGGANMLLPVMPLARERGHRTSALAAGPAAAVWRDAGEEEVDVGGGDAAMRDTLDRLAPGLVVTGTGYADFERTLWRLARDRGTRSLAAIDGWTSLRKRFLCLDGTEVQPDAICVVDERMRDQILGEGWCRVPLHVTGQPHLEAVVRRLGGRRAGRNRGKAPLLVFFSESLRRDYGGEGAGYDQFTVADALVPALAGLGPLTLVIQPHPRDDRGEWEAWVRGRRVPDGVALTLGAEDTESLLVACDGAIGMTTMVLMEAALLGVPVLSLQPGRTRVLNPGLEAVSGLRVVTGDTDIAPAMADFVRALGRPAPADPACLPLLADAGRRFLAAVEAELRAPQSAPR